MEKNPIVSVTYEDERISIKTAYLTQNVCYFSPCVVYGPIHGRFMGFQVNGFLSNRGENRLPKTTHKMAINRPVDYNREKTVYLKTHKTAINWPVDYTWREVTHILSKVSCFLLKSFHFPRLQKRQVFFPIQILIFRM